MAETPRLDSTAVSVDRIPLAPGCAGREDRADRGGGCEQGRGAALRVLRVRAWGTRPYRTMLDAMREFTEFRAGATEDELWLVQHRAVFTLGQAGRREHLILPGAVPVVQSDRGGQVTFSWPGPARGLHARRSPTGSHRGEGVRACARGERDRALAPDGASRRAPPRRSGGVLGRGENCVPRPPGQARLHLSRARPQCVRRSGALFPDRPLRVSGTRRYPALGPRRGLGRSRRRAGALRAHSRRGSDAGPTSSPWPMRARWNIGSDPSGTGHPAVPIDWSDQRTHLLYCYGITSP